MHLQANPNGNAGHGPWIMGEFPSHVVFDSLKVGRRPEIWWFEAPKRLRFAKILPAGFYHMGVSENSVPLNPMVLLIIIPFLNGYFIGNIPYFQTNPYWRWCFLMWKGMVNPTPASANSGGWKYHPFLVMGMWMMGFKLNDLRLKYTRMPEWILC